MLWIDSRSVESQKTVIDQLKRDLAELERMNEHYTQDIARIESKAFFYLDMQQRIIDNPNVMRTWQNFLTIVKLTLDDSVKGITYQ